MNYFEEQREKQLDELLSIQRKELEQLKSYVSKVDCKGNRLLSITLIEQIREAELDREIRLLEHEEEFLGSKVIRILEKMDPNFPLKKAQKERNSEQNVSPFRIYELEKEVMEAKAKSRQIIASVKSNTEELLEKNERTNFEGLFKETNHKLEILHKKELLLENTAHEVF
mmetsp:Transcript_7919/g.11153  ORF Transcript_7919/g.11153 Transcript_7919/m.11153 type:complete len:170 (-) Transcript_7919:12-521(-)